MKIDVKELIGKMLNTPVVVETGTSGIWTYRKWSDGTAEAWGYATGTTNSGGDWEYIAVAPSFFLITHHMYISATGWGYSNANAGVKYAYAYIVNNEWRIDTWLRQGLASVSCGVSYHIFGRWK